MGNGHARTLLCSLGQSNCHFYIKAKKKIFPIIQTSIHLSQRKPWLKIPLRSQQFFCGCQQQSFSSMYDELTIDLQKNIDFVYPISINHINCIQFWQFPQQKSNNDKCIKHQTLGIYDKGSPDSCRPSDSFTLFPFECSMQWKHNISIPIRC